MALPLIVVVVPVACVGGVLVIVVVADCVDGVVCPNDGAGCVGNGVPTAGVAGALIGWLTEPVLTDELALLLNGL